MCLPSPSVFEVLKWSEPRHTLQHSALVCSLWSQCSVSDLLWSAYFQSLHQTPPTSLIENESVLTAFQRQFLTAKRTLVVFSQTELQLFDCEEGRVSGTVTVGNARVSQCSAAIVMGDGEVFVCGGDLNEMGSFVMGRDGAVKDQREMTFKRTFHAAVQVNHRIYAFGGVYAKSAKTAEKYNLFQKKWDPLPNMITGRNCFTASAHKQLIYLCGGNVVECETFNISSEVYTPLTPRLPDTTWTTSFFYEQSLVIVQGSTFCFLQRTGLVTKPGLLALTP